MKFRMRFGLGVFGFQLPRPGCPGSPGAVDSGGNPYNEDQDLNSVETNPGTVSPK